jgi:hypothetical protein
LVFLKKKNTCQTLVRILEKLLDFYVKVEGANFNSMMIALKSIVDYEILGLEESFNGTCFGHAFPKLVSMLLLKRGYENVLSMSQSNLCNLISKNV